MTWKFTILPHTLVHLLFLPSSLHEVENGLIYIRIENWNFLFFPERNKMPKKKKGSGKLAKMTDEDRIIYLEQQRLAEEEMRKKKEDMLTQYLKASIELFYWGTVYFEITKHTDTLKKTQVIGKTKQNFTVNCSWWKS